MKLLPEHGKQLTAGMSQVCVYLSRKCKLRHAPVGCGKQA